MISGTTDPFSHGRTSRKRKRADHDEGISHAGHSLLAACLARRMSSNLASEA